MNGRCFLVSLIRPFCAAAWKDFRAVFSVVPAKQQIDLHLYYQTLNQASDVKLVQRRAELTRLDPSLPRRASKAFAVVYRAFRVAFERSGGDQQLFFQAVTALAPRPRKVQIVHSYHQSPRHIWVRGIVRAEPDLHKYARAIIQIMLAEIRAKNDKQNPDKAA